MIYRIYPTQDTTITSDFRKPSYIKLTGSNLGASEELSVFKRSGIPNVIGPAGSGSLGRALLQFDFSKFCSLTASGDLPSAGLTFTLRMNHKTHGGQQPSSFDVVIRAVEGPWDEGNGQDVNQLADLGFANWVMRQSMVPWTTPGGDSWGAPTGSAHFDTGFEDLEADIKPITDLWISGAIGNYGLSVSMAPAIESDSVYVDYYQKKFYSRQTDYQDRVPYIEVRADDSVRDDRVNMQWGRSGSLFLYNIVGGVFQSLPGNLVTVAVSDGSGTLLHLTASSGPLVGIYSASFCLPTGSSYSGSIFYDAWGSGSFAFNTGSFILRNSGPRQSVSQAPLTARIRNMQDEYLPEDVGVFEVMFRKKPLAVPVVQTASLGHIPYIVEQAYYAIENDSTRERVIPFGTGSQNHTRLSYGENGNSFKLFMTNLHAGNAYRVIFLVNEQGRRQVIDGGFKFRVV